MASGETAYLNPNATPWQRYQPAALAKCACGMDPGRGSGRTQAAMLSRSRPACRYGVERLAGSLQEGPCAGRGRLRLIAARPTLTVSSAPAVSSAPPPSATRRLRTSLRTDSSTPRAATPNSPAAARRTPSHRCARRMSVSRWKRSASSSATLSAASPVWAPWVLVGRLEVVQVQQSPVPASRAGAGRAELAAQGFFRRRCRLSNRQVVIARQAGQALTVSGANWAIGAIEGPRALMVQLAAGAARPGPGYGWSPAHAAWRGECGPSQP